MHTAPALRRLATGLLVLTAALLVLGWSGAWEGAMHLVQQWNRDLMRGLSGAVRAAREGSPAAVAALLGASFLYGVVHAAGPGHGKAVISAYVLADGRHLRHGLVLAWASALVQALTAILLVMGAVQLLGLAARQAQPAALLLERAGALILLALGAALLWSAWRQARPPGGQGAAHDHYGHSHSHHGHGHGHGHGACTHDAGCGHAHVPLPPAERTSWRCSAALVLSVGLRPCSGALLVLAFAHTLGIAGTGMLAALAMAVGTAMTVSVLAVLTVGARGVALRLAGGDGQWISRVEVGLRSAGGLALLVLGGLLLGGSLQMESQPLFPGLR